MENKIIDSILQPLGYIELIITQNDGADEDDNKETGKSIMGKNADMTAFFKSVKKSENIGETLRTMFSANETQNSEDQNMMARISNAQMDDLDDDTKETYNAFKNKVVQLKNTDVEELKKNKDWIGMFLKDDDIAELLDGPDMEGGRRRRRRRKSRKSRKGRKSRKSRRKGKKSRRKGKKARRRTRRRRRR